LLLLRKLTTTIGRQDSLSKTDIQIPSASLSKEHLKVQYSWESECFELVCLGKQAVEVDGEPFSRYDTPLPLDKKVYAFILAF
jgi:hypothetical protein